MNKITGLVLAASIMMLGGCATKEDTIKELKEELTAEKPIGIYSAPPTAITLSDEWNPHPVLGDFPFVASVMPYNFQGKFHTDFYDKLTVSWKAVALDRVDWSAFAKNPKLYDIIYLQNVGIADSGPIADDFMTNIAKAYNISPADMEQMKRWISEGGVLWSEAGVCASRFETFYPSGGINDVKTMGLFSKERGKVFGVPARYRLLKSASIDMVNYEPQRLLLKAAGSASQLSGVSKVIFNQKQFVESYPIIDEHPLLVDQTGTVYAGYGTVGKGLIITTVPSVYWQADDDGELYRWKLLSWVMQRKGEQSAKYLENPLPKQK